MSTIERQRRRRTPSPHTALARLPASLVRTGRRLLRSTEDLLGTSEGLEYEDADALDVLLAQLDVLTAVVAERLTAGSPDEEGATLGQLGTSLVELQTFRSAAHDHEVHERLGRMEALEAGLSPLRFVHNPDELLSKACEAVVHSCGFDRAMLSRVEDSTWRPWKSYAVADREFEREFRSWITQDPGDPARPPAARERDDPPSRPRARHRTRRTTPTSTSRSSARVGAEVLRGRAADADRPRHRLPARRLRDRDGHRARPRHPVGVRRGVRAHLRARGAACAACATSASRCARRCARSSRCSTSSPTPRSSWPCGRPGTTRRAPRAGCRAALAGAGLADRLAADAARARGARR